MRQCRYLPIRLPLPLMAALCTLVLVFPGRVDANSSSRHHVGTGTRVTIAFGQEMGNIRPFRVTIAARGAITLTGPIHFTNDSHTISKDAVAGLVLLAEAEGLRALPSFTACPGALPDIAARFISIQTRTWRHRASARGQCVSTIDQLFAVLMNATHASY